MSAYREETFFFFGLGRPFVTDRRTRRFSKVINFRVDEFQLEHFSTCSFRPGNLSNKSFLNYAFSFSLKLLLTPWFRCCRLAQCSWRFKFESSILLAHNRKIITCPRIIHYDMFFFFFKNNWANFNRIVRIEHRICFKIKLSKKSWLLTWLWVVSWGFITVVFTYMNTSHFSGKLCLIW